MEIKIGELAVRTKCETVTIRYYEKEGYCQSQRAVMVTSGSTVSLMSNACNSFAIVGLWTLRW